MAEPSVVCPKCGHRFPVTKALTDQIEESLRDQYEADARQKEKVAQAAYEKRLEAERQKIEKLAMSRAAEASTAKVGKLQALLAQAEKREKHLDLVLHNVSGMIGDIQAITPAFPRIKRLELPGPRNV